MNGFEIFVIATTLLLILGLMNVFKLSDALAKKIVGQPKEKDSADA